jgi:hypothetical protein
MISDFDILGIRETTDISIIKGAYRRRLKELHPDVSKEEDSFERHVLFVEVCQAYKRLMGQKREPIEKKAEPKTNTKASGMVLHSDPSYVFYKNGMKQFMKIHPSQWNIDTNGMLNTKIAGDDKEQEIIRGRVLGLVKLFPKAYYYFSIVVHEYPDSIWAYDAQEKMVIIEDRTRMYKKIIESFSTWNVDAKERIRKFDETYAKHAEMKKTIGPKDEEEWKQ